MTIRLAKETDIPAINDLLFQVLSIHQKGRPDLFKANAKKYTDNELRFLLNHPEFPVFVAVDESDQVKGYALCKHKQQKNHNILTDVKTLYIDDLCVDESVRGRHIGKMLYEHVLDYAKENGFHNLTLNVWAFNENAIRFYEACGLSPQRIFMEKIL